MEGEVYLGVTVDTAESDTEDDFVGNVDKMVAARCTIHIGVGFPGAGRSQSACSILIATMP